MLFQQFVSLVLKSPWEGLVNEVNSHIYVLTIHIFYPLGCSKDFVFDVGFAIDGSGSIDNNEYRLTKDFVLDIIGIFSVSDEGTHIALLEYASEAPIKIYFDDNFDLLNEVKGLKQSKGHTTNIGTGLKQSLAMFDVNNGMRQEVRSFFY